MARKNMAFVWFGKPLILTLRHIFIFYFSRTEHDFGILYFRYPKKVYPKIVYPKIVYPKKVYPKIVYPKIVYPKIVYMHIEKSKFLCIQSLWSLANSII